MSPPDVTRLKPADRIEGDGPEDTKLLYEMHAEARHFLLGFKWCRAIRNSWFGCGVGGVVAVFLFEIDPAEPDVDSLLWTVTGDVPPAYLVTDEAPDPGSALTAYISELRAWIAAVRTGQGIDECIPVNATPDEDTANKLDKRVDFMERQILPRCSA